MSEQETVDINGKVVKAGTFVRVLYIDESVLLELNQESQIHVRSMIGQNLAVYEVDQYGRAWVEQWWRESNSQSTSHSLALEPQHMELCT